MTDKNANTEIRKEFCPNCEAETPCTHEAELFVCDICGEDFAKYIVSRKANVSDVSMTQDVLTDIKTLRSIENNNPDYHKQELARRDEQLQDERRWIPVSERLPEIHDDYDGEKSDCCYVIDIHKCVWIAYYRPDEKGWYELPAGIILTTITHWMPLPEPPEGERC